MKKLLNGLLRALPWLALLAIFGLGVYFRFYHLGWWGLTYDECLSEERSHWSLWHLWRYYITGRAPVNALIYFLDGRLFSLVNGEPLLKEWQLRLPSLLFGCAAIPFLFALGRRVKDNLCGLLLAALGASSFLLLGFSREARYYSFLTFFVILLYYEAAAILRRPAGDRGALKHYAIYALVSIGGLGTHQGFYILFLFSGLFLGFYSLLPLLAGLFRRAWGELPDRLNLLWSKALLLGLPCLACCYQFLITSSADKPYTPTGDGAAHLLPALSWEVMAEVSRNLWRAAPFAPHVLAIFLGAALLLLFTRNRRLALYALFIKFSTFVFLRLATTRLTYEQFREKYVLFLLVIDMVVISGALAQAVEWLWKLPGLVFRRHPEGRRLFELAGATLTVLLLCGRLMEAGFDGASQRGLFAERQEAVRYAFDYLEKVYRPGDVVVFQAEPNSWTHKNFLYEQRLRKKNRWIVLESVNLPFIKDHFTRGGGNNLWFFMMHRPTRDLLPYFFRGMRTFGSEGDEKNVMIGCRTADPIKSLPDAVFLTAYLYHNSGLRVHPQYERHLIQELAHLDCKDAIYSSMIARTLETGEMPRITVKDILAEPDFEFQAYALVNEWWAGLNAVPPARDPMILSSLEGTVFRYLKVCYEKNDSREQEAAKSLLTFPHGFWLYDRIYRFTWEGYQRPYVPPSVLALKLSNADILKYKDRLDKAYNHFNPSMKEDWQKLYDKAWSSRRAKEKN